MSETSQGPEWWLASDGRWYPPTDNSGYVLAPPDPAYASTQYLGYHPGRSLRPTNALAIASLILSIVWFFGLGSVLAVTFALVALSKITASKGGQGGRGLAVAGLIIGICGLIGSVGFFVILNGHLSANNRLNDQVPTSRPPPVTLPAAAKPPASTIGPPVTLPAAARTQSTANPLGVTLNVTDPSGHDFTKVLVLDVAYPVSLGAGSYAIASVGVCAGPGGSQTAPVPTDSCSESVGAKRCTPDQTRSPVWGPMRARTRICFWRSLLARHRPMLRITSTAGWCLPTEGCSWMDARYPCPRGAVRPALGVAFGGRMCDRPR